MEQSNFLKCLECSCVLSSYHVRKFRKHIHAVNASIRAPATKVKQNLSIVAKNENSTDYFVHLHADYLVPDVGRAKCSGLNIT